MLLIFLSGMMIGVIAGIFLSSFLFAGSFDDERTELLAEIERLKQQLRSKN